MSAAAVYAAEDAAFGGTDHDELVALDTITEVVAGLTNGEWWRSCAGPPVVLRMARAGATTSTARSYTVGTAPPRPITARRAGARSVGAAPPPSGSAAVVVHLATPSSSTVSHELAHALAGVASGHDARFRAAHVDVVAMLAGARVADLLEQAYAAHGVPAGRRHWPGPVRLSGPGFVMT